LNKEKLYIDEIRKCILGDKRGTSACIR